MEIRQVEAKDDREDPIAPLIWGVENGSIPAEVLASAFHRSQSHISCHNLSKLTE